VPHDRCEEWGGRRWFSAPQSPRLRATVRGVAEIVHVRTWAGCSFVVGEESTYPGVPVLEVDGVSVPLLRGPDDADTSSKMQLEVCDWTQRHAHSGPPYAPSAPAWFEIPPACLGRALELSGFWYPAFDGGTIRGFTIWGLVVAPPRRGAEG
jgi:hypothetical protein